MKTIFFTMFTFLRRSIYFCFSMLDRSILKRKSQISILCYHSIATPGWLFSVSVEEFKKQITFLKKEGYTFITLDDVWDFMQEKKDITSPSVVINFDDGYKDVLQVKDFLHNLNIKPALFVLSDEAQANRKELNNDKPFMTKADILSLKKNGWIIGSHSATHADFYALTPEQISLEIIGSKKDLEEKLGFPIEYLAYPRGRYTDSILATMKKAKYKLGLSMNDSVLSRQSDRYCLPRIGVNGSHSFNEFKTIFSPSVINLRGFIKSKLGGII